MMFPECIDKAAATRECAGESSDDFVPSCLVINIGGSKFVFLGILQDIVSCCNTLGNGIQM